MARQRVTLDEMDFRSGVMRATLKAWRYKNAPSLQNISAVLSVLGFDFVPIPRTEVLPREVVAELQPIADRLGLSMAATVRALVEVVAGIHARRPAIGPSTTLAEIIEIANGKPPQSTSDAMAA